MKHPPLFAYGTLMDEGLQRILLGRLAAYSPATLPGHRLFSDVDGYYYVWPQPGSQVAGLLLDLTPAELRVTDLWEEVPHYVRRRHAVILPDGSSLGADVYVKTAPAARIPAQPGSLSLNADEQVLAAAKELRRELDGKQQEQS